MKTAGRYPRFFTSYSGSGMTGVAPAILQRNGDEEGSIADALHRYRHEDRGTTTTCCRDDGRDSVAPAILQRNGDEDGGPKGAELLCNRG